MPADVSLHYADNDHFNDTTTFDSEHGYGTTWQAEDNMTSSTGITISPRELQREFTPIFEDFSSLAAIPSNSNYIRDEYAFAQELFRDTTPLTRDNSPYVLLPPQSAAAFNPLQELADSVPGLVFDATTGLLDGSFDRLAAAALMSSSDHDMSVPEVVEWMEQYGKKKLSSFGLRITNGLLDGAHNVLVFAVLLLAPAQQMRLKDIYAAIKKNTTKRQAKNCSGWQNGVRHNLSMNDAFVKGRRIVLEDDDDDDKRNHWWHVTDDALESGVQPTTRYRNSTNTHSSTNNDDADDDDDNDSGIDEVDDDDDEADYRPTRSKRSGQKTQHTSKSGHKAQHTSKYRRLSKRQKAGSKGGKASSKHKTQKLRLDARRAQSVASDSFARSESPSPNIGNDSGYGSFNDASSIRARSGTPMSFRASPSPYYSIEGSGSGSMLPISFQRASTAEPLRHSYADYTNRARSATPASHNVAVMLMNRRQPKQIPRNTRAMTAPPSQQPTQMAAFPYLRTMLEANSNGATQHIPTSDISGNDFSYNFGTFASSSIDPGLCTDSRTSSPFTSFDDAMEDEAMYHSSAHVSMASDSPYFNTSCANDADVQYMSLEEQVPSSGCFENYYHSNDAMMVDPVCRANELAMKEEEDAMKMFMNLE